MSKPKTRASTTQNIKNHPLEGDGVVTGFYNFLHKRHPKTMKPCKDVLIPDTIVFDHNFPRGWYTSDLKSREISKRQGRELDAASIAEGFCKPPSADVNVVASYMSSCEEDDKVTGESVTVTSVEFFNEETLKDFVARKTKREGILQRFIVPKGLRNNVIQAVWSPRVCMVQRRTNRGSIKDRLQCERDPYPLAVTYEGPSHFSEEGTCASHTTEQVKSMCANIKDHFLATEHKYITRMVLYFKVDDNDQLWLLWCGSMRVSDKDSKSELAINLAPKFDSPSLAGAGARREDEVLHDADIKHLELTHDALFYSTYVKPYNDERDAESTARATGGVQSDTAGGKRAKDRRDDGADDGERDEDWHKNPAVQDAYRELCIEREMVSSHFEDVFYEAYGHFLRYDPGPFNFEVDKRVAQALGPESLGEMMAAVKIDHALASDDAVATADDDELMYTIPVQRSGPVKQMGDAVARWLRGYYEKREQELKDEAGVAPVQEADAEDGKEDEEVSEAKEEPKKEEPKKEEPKKEEQEEPKQEEPKQEEPKQEEPKQEEPKQEEPKQEEPKQEEPKEEEAPVEEASSKKKEEDDEGPAWMDD